MDFAYQAPLSIRFPRQDYHGTWGQIKLVLKFRMLPIEFKPFCLQILDSNLHDSPWDLKGKFKQLLIRKERDAKTREWQPRNNSAALG